MTTRTTIAASAASAGACALTLDLTAPAAMAAPELAHHAASLVAPAESARQ